MKKLVSSIVFAAALAGFGVAQAEEAQNATEAHGMAAMVEHAAQAGHYPILPPKEIDWSFAGPFGKYDKAQLQRGLKIYTEVCSACHSMKLVAFRSLEDLGYSEEQVKAFAANYEVEDGPNADGDMFTRTAVPSDHFPSPFPNAEAAAASNNGAAPPDFSLLAKARGVTRGFPQFVIDIFTQYQEGGPDYIYSLLTGYEETPEGVEIGEGTYFNPHFGGAAALSMAQPIDDGMVTYDDGSPETLDQYAQDVAAFLMWAAEPHLEERKHTGFMVMVFLSIFAMLVYLTKRSVYANKEH